jgi:DNA polymerase I
MTIPVWTLDFETLPIGPRPEHYPPKPVGLASRRPDGHSVYITEFSEMHDELHEAFHGSAPILFHNAKFDLAVAEEWFYGTCPRRWDLVHDTMLLAFLMDPYAKTLGLKQLAELWLGLPPDERNVVDEWVLANKDRLPLFEFIKNSKGEPFAKPTKKSAGAWIGFAPVELVAPYAIGDVDRTWRLFQTLMPLVAKAGMADAYDVERQVMPIFMENERVGLRVDQERLEHDVHMYRQAFAYVEEWLRWRLQSPGLSFDNDRDVASVLEQRGVVTEWTETESGQKSVSKKNLHPDHFSDKEMASALGYRNRLQTCLDKHMQPMLDQAKARGGRAMGEWNQVASPEGGTRTGRPSMRGLNLLNVSKSFEGRPDGYEHPAFLAGLPALPLVREYILPDEGQVILKRDFSGQELHVFGHFEHGELQAQYRANPRLDVHTFVGDKAKALMGRDIPRANVKILNFQSIYGGGVPAAQREMRVTYAEAREFKDFHDKALPGRKVLSDTLSSILRSGMAVRTLGGRLYVREPVRWDAKKQRWSDHDYAMLNYLVQGSSAEITKRAMIRLHENSDFKSRFLLAVYDEMNISAPIDDAVRQMEVLLESMEGIELRTSLPTDGEWGWTWGAMHKIKGAIADALKELPHGTR